MKLKLPKKENVLFYILAIGIVICIVLNIIALSRMRFLSESLASKPIEPENQFSAEQELLQLSAKYMLYECGGKIGIYDASSNTIIDIIDILVCTLPKNDRTALKKGIEVFSLSELSNIIDDFSS